MNRVFPNKVQKLSLREWRTSAHHIIPLKTRKNKDSLALEKKEEKKNQGFQSLHILSTNIGFQVPSDRH